MENTVFEIAGREYNVVKKGLAQAAQVAQLGKWLASHGAPIIKEFQGLDMTKSDTFEVVSKLVNGLTPEALVELHSVVFGCGYAVSVEEFDVAVTIEGITALYNNQPSIKRLVSRFFSEPASPTSGEDNSTKSE